MLVRLLIEVDMFSVSPIMDWKRKEKTKVDMFSVSPIMDWKRKEKTIIFDIKCHDSYLMKCLYNNISQNDTIC